MPSLNSSETQSKRNDGLVGLVLVLAIAAAYSPLWRSGFVAYDDNDYVTANEMVRGGLTGAGFIWAFTTFHASNWHPVTWISHMADCQLCGLNPLGHHLTNLLLHAANAILLFLLLRGMTRDFWRSALAAGFFALHPLHVESVAWISERKDVLSTLFWLLSVGAYVRYTRAAKGWKNYAASVVLFALGLMAKPMLITLPFILFLLDYWPLQRFGQPLRRLILEKIPFLVLSAASCAVTLVAQRRGGATSSLALVPLDSRLENIPMALVRYVAKTVWPSDLAVLYPYEFHWPWWQIVGAVILLALVTVWALRQPVRVAGWFWFLIMLAPVIGLVQAGAASMADRYCYLANTGLFILVLWSVPAKLPVAGMVLAACAVLTFHQALYWRNSETLFTHALAVTKNNPIMESNLGKVLSMDNRMEEALPHLQRAVELDPQFALAHYNLGKVLLAKGSVDQAFAEFDMQTTLQPNDPIAQLNFGSLLLEYGLPADARPHLEKALQLRPDDAQAASELAWLLATAPDPSLRNGPRAVQLAQQANERFRGQDPKTLGILAAALAESGDFPRAIATAEHALQLTASGDNEALAKLLRSELSLYRAGKPFRDTAKP